MGYKLSSGTAVSHLLYMYDLKLYGKNHNEVESLLHTVEIFNSDIKMNFGVRKCAYIGLKRGKVCSIQDIVLCNGESICSLALSCVYKYLGLLEADVFQQSEVRDKVTKKYYRRVCLVLKSELNARNKFLSINAYTIPVVCYTVGLINWPTGLLKENDEVKLWWDFNIWTDKVISAHRPDIVVINKLDNAVQLIDVSIPANCHIVTKENEKIEKYQDLRIELERLWQKKTFVIPIVIGKLGTFSKKFPHYVDLLHLRDVKYFHLQRLALLGMASIFHRVLQLSGTG